MQRVVPALWFNKNAEAAVDFYSEVFPDFEVLSVQRYPLRGLHEFQEPLAGQVLTIDFEIGGFKFVAINGADDFRPNPSVSFMVNFDPSESPDPSSQLEVIHEKLVAGGTELMPLGEYEFSDRYAWVEDQFGVSWQLLLTESEAPKRPFIVPSLMFTDATGGGAAEAIPFYISVFGGQMGQLSAAPSGDDSSAERIVYADFALQNQWFAATDNEQADFSFGPGVSLIVECADQGEIDKYWSELSRVPEAEECGWCTDQFGLNWQVVPRNMDDMVAAPRAFARMLQMKKIVISELLG